MANAAQAGLLAAEAAIEQKRTDQEKQHKHTVKMEEEHKEKAQKAESEANQKTNKLAADEIEKLVAIIQNPRQFKIPLWFLNRQKDFNTGKYTQVFAQNVDAKLRDDIERLKKIRAHRGLRHWWGIRVRGQHTCSTGRRKH